LFDIDENMIFLVLGSAISRVNSGEHCFSRPSERASPRRD